MATTTMNNVVNNPPREIVITYECEDDEHFFEAPSLPGFLVAGRDLTKLYSNLEQLLAVFVRAEFGVSIEYALDRDYPTFMDAIQRHTLRPGLIAIRKTG